MNPGSSRKVALLLSVGWLLLLLLGSTAGRLGIGFFAVGAAVVAVFWLASRVLPRARQAIRAARPRKSFEVALRSPSPRYGDRSPVPFEVLARLLADAELGTVASVSEGRGRQVLDRAGDFAVFFSEDPAAVVRSNLRLEASSFELAALCCDAIATRVGPLELEAEGMKIEVDGTLPRIELERQLHEQQLVRARRLRAELDALQTEAAAKERSGRLPN